MKEPTIETPHQLFSAPVRYYAPVFQRLYVWGEAELDALLEDITSAEKTNAQFLGAIVLKDMGKLKGPTSPMTYLIIDGQQRLTTLFMILAVTAHIAEESGMDEIARYIEREYLVQSRSPAFAGQPKLVPTMQDRESLWGRLEESLPSAGWNFSADPGDGKSAARLERQWDRIISKISDLVFDEKRKLIGKNLSLFLTQVQEQLSFIVITLDESDDANVIFNKLNTAGVPLNLADLVRNEIFSKFSSADAKKADKFYDTRWHPFERSFRDKDLNIFVPVYSYVVFGGAVTKAGAFSELQRRWKDSSPSAILGELQDYAGLFQALMSGTAITGFTKELNGMINRFSRMPRTTVTWPYILQVLRASQKNGDQNKAVRCLEIVESFLVRRALAGVEPTGLHAVFKGLWQSAGTDPGKLESKIITRTIKVPSDKDLEVVLTSEAVDTRVILPYVLAELERDFRKSNKFDAITETVATIEHVMPKKRGANWEVPLAKNHDLLVGELGNLVPLSGEQNKSQRDDPWVKKRARFKGSNFLLAQEIAAIGKWDEAAIKKRTKKMAARILKRWPAATA